MARDFFSGVQTGNAAAGYLVYWVSPTKVYKMKDDASTVFLSGNFFGIIYFFLSC